MYWIISNIIEMSVFVVREIAHDRFAQCIILLTLFLLAGLVIYQLRLKGGKGDE